VIVPHQGYDDMAIKFILFNGMGVSNLDRAVASRSASQQRG
jgi:hypothetical protein